MTAQRWDLRKVSRTIMLTVFTLSCALPGIGQTAEEIVDRYVAAIGGQAALDDIQTLRIVRDFEHVEEGRVERGIYYFKRPDLYRYEAGSGLVCIIMSGGRAWRKTRGSADGPWQPWEEIEHGAKYILDWLGPFLDHRARRIKLQYLGVKTKNGTDLVHLRMTTPEDISSDVYFGAESRLYAGFRNKRLMDYRPVSGILFPFREEMIIALPSGERSTVSRIISIDINVPLYDSFFAPEK